MRLNIDLTQGKIKRNVFFTSDFHCYHKNVLKFDDRPFEDVEAMHIALEERWNEVVSKDDIVIYLGDLSFARREEMDYVKGMMHNLNGTIHYVMGNHDKLEDIKKIGVFESISDYLEVRVAHMGEEPNNIGALKRVETLFCCMHYPILEWNKKHRGSWLVHGHCHMNLFNNDSEWVSKMEAMGKLLPKDILEEYNALVEKKHYYKGRVVDAGCMGWDYRPLSYEDILKMGDDRKFGLSDHH
jgi:calcineurin-like phosphoesterase family protein